MIHACSSPSNGPIVPCLTSLTHCLFFSFLLAVFFFFMGLVVGLRRLEGMIVLSQNFIFPQAYYSSEAKRKMSQNSVVVYSERHYPRIQTKKVLAHYSIRASHHLTSIPPHSNTRNKSRSDARTKLTPTTRAQNVAPSSAVARVAACSQNPKSSAATPRKSMKTRVTTSGAGETRICAACSYEACERKRSATYSCLSKFGSQYLNRGKSQNPQEGKRGEFSG